MLGPSLGIISNIWGRVHSVVERVNDHSSFEEDVQPFVGGKEGDNGLPSLISCQAAIIDGGAVASDGSPCLAIGLIWQSSIEMGGVAFEGATLPIQVEPGGLSRHEAMPTWEKVTKNRSLVSQDDVDRLSNKFNRYMDEIIVGKFVRCVILAIMMGQQRKSYKEATDYFETVEK
ncbi:hypothetical protein Pfo_002291 [Paulownia fortunei]|nr:hypothetical protein Pfo_002291 [Paulownia fortunei]